jgi:predicted nucleic acid-binding Zn ribbon protein
MNLHALAATIPIPVDARGNRGRAYCVTDREGYRVVFSVDCLTNTEPVGPAFKRPREACELASLLNGGQEPRVVETVAVPTGPRGGRRCVVCRRQLSSAARADRETCSNRCRTARARQRDAEIECSDAAEGGVPRDVTLSAAPSEVAG